MITAISHTHILVVVLFLLLLLVKAFLLFFNRHDTLNKVRSSTKMLDVVFGLLIFITGIFLALNYHGQLPNWLLIKVGLVLAAVPVAVVGIKKHNKVLTAVGILLFLYVYGVAETKSLKMRPDKGGLAATSPKEEMQRETPPPAKANHPIITELQGTQLENTKAIYTNLCAACHGQDGQKGTGGATNLQTSTLTPASRQQVIANGRGLMPGFGSQLTEQEIEALALYSTLLKK
ncbi:c-type cytochrome [Rufibacter soli]|jgi:cytochrome c553